MKKLITFLISISSLLFIIILVGCKGNVNVPVAIISNDAYSSEIHTISFNVEINDVDSIGSNYKVSLINQSSNKEDNQVINISELQSTAYSFSNITDGSTYMLCVTCDYNSKTDERIGCKYITASKSIESNLAQELGITFNSASVAYDKNEHYLYAKYGEYEIKSDFEINGYLLSYSSSNSKQTEPGEYTFKLNIYRKTVNLFKVDCTLVDTISATLTITKAKTLYSFSDDEVEYSGEDYKYPFTYEGLTYTAYNSNNELATPNIPGEYTIKYSFAGDDHYEALSGEYKLTITKAKIESYLTSQVTSLDENGTAKLKINDSDFSVSGILDEDYTVKYYDSSNNLVDNITENGVYKCVVTIPGNEYYDTLETFVTLYVLDDTSNKLLVSNIASFSVVNTSYNNEKTTDYFNYVQLYNNSNESIDLSKVTLSVDNTGVKINGTLAPNSTYTILIYSKSYYISSFIGRTRVNFKDYADTYCKNSKSDKLDNVKILFNGIESEYTFETSYDDFVATLDKSNTDFINNKYEYTYNKYESLNELLNVLSNMNYTLVSPTITFNKDTLTISESRINDLYDVTILDGLGNKVELDKSQVDTSMICAKNVGKYVDVIYNVSDTYGNSLSITKKYLVVDEEGPVITLNENAKTKLNLGEEVYLTTYFKAYDEVDGNIAITADMISTNLDTSISDAYYVTVTVKDKAGNASSLTITVRVGISYLNLNDLTNETIKTSDTGEAAAMPSSGNVDVLVLPIAFDSSTTTSNTPLSTLNNVFNGTSATVSNESVSSYYLKSSYGKLNLSFDIYDNWISMPYIPKSYAYYDSNIDEAIKYALYIISDKYDLSKYDSDNDGYIDSIWFVYDINYIKNSNYFWAWTSDYSNKNFTFGSKTVGKIAFASLEFTNAKDSYYSGYNENTNGTLTARTFIHETGHLLGLEDYYDYDYDVNVGYSHAMFGMTMMDQNLGDLDAASKLLLGWINPIVVSSSDNITIGSTALNNENVILISSNIESTKSIFGEYILLEFWTPDGLNEYDSNKTFGTNAYGIRVLHLDATINYINGVATKTTGSRPSYFKYNNTDNDSKNLLETLALYPNNVYNSLTQKYSVKDNVLFNTTDITFGKDVYSNWTYNSGKSLDFTFKISNISNTQVTLSINFE